MEPTADVFTSAVLLTVLIASTEPWVSGQEQHHQFVSLAILVKPLPRGKLYAVQDHVTVMRTGATFDLDCFINPGLEKPTDRAAVQWMKDGRRFERSNDAKIIGWLPGGQWQDYQIRFFNFTVENAGVYTCHTPRGSVNVSLTVTPIVTSLSEDQRVFEGQTLALRCHAKGFPPSVLTWTKPSGEESTGLETGQSSLLTIEKVSRDDNGTYHCAAVNSAGQAERETHVLVMERLRFTNLSRPGIVSDVGDLVQLLCQVGGYPAPRISWHLQQSGRPARLLRQSGTILTISSFSADSEGNYTCTARSFAPCCANEEVQPAISTSFILTLESSVGPKLTGCVAGVDKGCPSGAGSQFIRTSLASLLILLVPFLLALHC